MYDCTCEHVYVQYISHMYIVHLHVCTHVHVHVCMCTYDIVSMQSSSLSPYADYCANLVVAKQTLQARRQDPALEDFLQVYMYIVCIYVYICMYVYNYNYICLYTVFMYIIILE